MGDIRWEEIDFDIARGQYSLSMTITDLTKGTWLLLALQQLLIQVMKPADFRDNSLLFGRKSVSFEVTAEI